MANIFINVKTNAQKASQQLKTLGTSMMGLGSKTATTNVNMAKFQNNITKTNMKLTNLTKDANRASTSVSGLGKSFGILNMALGTGAVIAMASALAGIVQANVAMNETANLFAVSMGDSTAQAEEFVQSMSNVFGLDTTNMRNAVGTFGLLSRSMGMSNDQAETLATNTTKLGVDLASLMNVPVNQVMQDLRSGLVGQSETMYKYGVDVTEASLKAEALAQGITKSVRNMGQGEKMALRYAVMLKQTALAQGDFALTINQPANQLKILSERFTTLTRTIGGLFMPILGAVLPYVNALVILLQRLFTYLGALLGYKPPQPKDFVRPFTPISESAEEAEGAVGGVSKAVKKLKQYMLGIDELNVISPPTDSAGGGGAGAGGMEIGSLEGFDIGEYDNLMSKVTDNSKVMADNMQANLGKVWNLIKTMGEYMNSAFAPYFQKAWSAIAPEVAEFGVILKNIWGDMSTLAEPFMGWINNQLIPLWQQTVVILGIIIGGLFDTFNMVFADIWDIVMFPLLQKFLTTGLPIMSEFGMQVNSTFLVLFNEVKSIFDKIWREGVAPALRSIVNMFLGFIDELDIAWKEHGGIIFEEIKTLFISVGSTFMNVWNKFLSPVWNYLIDAIDTLWNKHLQPLVAKILDFTATLIECALKILNQVVIPIINSLVTLLAPAFTMVFKTIIDVVTVVIGMIIDVIGGLLLVLQGIIKFLTGVFTGDWKLAWEGIKDVFAGIIESLIGIMKGVCNGVIAIINAMLRGIETGINYIVKALNNIDIDIPDWVPEYGGESFGLHLNNVKFNAIPMLAKGGILDVGDVFQAGEAGAELIGSYNNKTTVMPLENSGFVEAMYEAVLGAMTNAQASGGQVIENIINLDGEVLYKNQQKVGTSRGHNYGMGVFAR